MTTVVTLPPEPAEVPALTADPEEIRRCGGDLIVASAQLDDLGTFVAGEARVSAWTGEAATAYHEELRPAGRRADAMSLALRGVAQRVDAHAEEMTALRERRVGLDDWRRHLVLSIAGLRERITRATVDEAAELQAEADALLRQVEGFGHDLGSWVQDVGAEEAAMNLAFARVLTLDQVEEEYGGVADPADGALATKPPPGSSPTEVNAWWLGLTEAQRRAVIAASPGSIGNVDGIPAGARDDANRVSLARDLAQLSAYGAAGALSAAEKRRLTNAEAAQDAVDRIEGGLDPVTGEPVTAQVYLYDPRAFGGDGAVAVAAGDLDTADNVAVTVPGLGTDGGSAGYQGQRALNLYEASRNLDPTATNATMFWIGYDAPSGLDAGGVVTEGMATEGGDRLADTLDGLRDSRPGEPAHLTAIGNSYGSTTLGHAASDHALPVDDLVFTGSPGLGGSVDHASDLGLDDDHVWAGANSLDPVSYLGDNGWVGLGDVGGLGLGTDPTDEDFGGTRFQAESTSRPPAPWISEHGEYYEPDTESLHNIAGVVNGDYGDVTTADGRHDPWYGGVQDPEGERSPTAPDTDGR